MKKEKLIYDYSNIFQCFKLYEYMYQCAKKELSVKNAKTLVSDRSERLVIDYPDKFIKKYFPELPLFPDEGSPGEDIRKMIYGVLRSKRLSILMWTDDNRSLCGAGKDTIHVIKPDSFSKRIPAEIEFLLEEIEKKLSKERHQK